MTSYVYRCNRCRTRNTFREPLWRFVEPKKCRNCSHTSFYLDKERMRRVPCYCDGGLFGRTGSVPHRPGSPCCVQNPMHPLHRARALGAPSEVLQDIAIDLAWEGDGGRVADLETVPF